MVLVKAPFFSTFATGSFGKTLTCRPLWNGNKFAIQMYKQRSGKRHPVQIENARIFKERMQYFTKAQKEFFK